MTRTGDAVTCWTLAAEGIELEVLDHGAIIRALRVPDRHGAPGDVVLGHETLDAYEADPFQLGTMVGRVAGRIRGAAFTLDGVRHRLAATADGTHLHGGVRGFGARPWSARPVACEGGAALELRRTSPHGEEGYPGTVEVVLTYTVTRGRLDVAWTATTDRATPVNLTQHAYFDLSAGRGGDVRAHTVQVHASRHLVLDAALLPTGAIADVAGTPFDLRAGAVLGDRLDDPHPPLRAARGFDLTYLLDDGADPAAVVTEPVSGRTLTVRTTEPALQFYTGNFLDMTPPHHVGRRFARHAGLCLETQHCPDAPNQPQFASVIVWPGEVRRSATSFTFGCLP
ncbi:MAG: galactose mutarotase [Gemmatimonadaceae bacterium]|nr:galactose mutarotase [Gemmatimonadaceae bacterium]